MKNISRIQERHWFKIGFDIHPTKNSTWHRHFNRDGEMEGVTRGFQWSVYPAITASLLQWTAGPAQRSCCPGRGYTAQCCCWTSAAASSHVATGSVMSWTGPPACCWTGSGGHRTESQRDSVSLWKVHWCYADNLWLVYSLDESLSFNKVSNLMLSLNEQTTDQNKQKKHTKTVTIVK